MDKATALVAIVFFVCFLQFLCHRLVDLSAYMADKAIGVVPAFFIGCFKLSKGSIELVFIVLKAVVRVCVRMWRFYTTGVTKEERTAVGPSEVHVTVHPPRTENILGHSAKWKIGTAQRAPVTIDHSHIRR